MHQVTNNLIRPATLHHDQLPGLSYALLHNFATGGLRCDLFFSHAWNEGIFEFIDNALAAWADENCGAYIVITEDQTNAPLYWPARIACSEGHRFAAVSSSAASLILRIWTSSG